MLQNQAYQEQLSGEDVGGLFTPARIYEIVKRRSLYFLIPFLTVLAVGSVVTLAWPAKYLAEGKILISSQEIPKDLVRPTVVSLATERVQVIGQRILTRDNLLTIAKKYQISNNSWQGLSLSGTEIVDFIRERTQIKPMALKLPSESKRAIAFTVGFEYEQPQIAMKVANELVTMILAEDARTRSAFAAETTKFLERELKRLETQLGQLDSQMTELKLRIASTGGDPTKSGEGRGLAALKAELRAQSAIYSESHPNIRALKRKIAAFEKSTSPSEGSDQATDAPLMAELDALETKRKGAKEELTATAQKLAAARLGESLERGQHSERLEVLEQPSLPQKPVSPNRPRIFLVVSMLALMAGGGMALGSEILNQSIRRSADLYTLIDSHLIVAIPYISTRAEERGKKRRTVLASVVVGGLILSAIIAVLFILPPVDVMFAKAMKALAR